MHRYLCVAFGAATAVAVFGLTGCLHRGPRVVSPPTSVIHATTSPIIVATPPTAPLPASDALVDVLNRLADPNVPGTDKMYLVEDATPESAGNIDKFTTALRDNGYLPMTFAANNIAWSNPSHVVATITVNTSQAQNRNFTFPMEFTPFQGGWQLSRRTAEMLLALGNSPAPSPAPAPSPTPPG